MFRGISDDVQPIDEAQKGIEPRHGTKKPDLSAGSSQKIDATCRTYREEKPSQKIDEVSALNLEPSNVTRDGSA